MKPRTCFCKPPGRLTRFASLVLALAMFTSPAQAAFHFWNIREVYTDASGSLQFIEFFTSSSSQQFVGGQQVQLIGATTQTFNIPSNLPGDTFNHAFLLGTSGLQAAGGPVPDYIIPNGFVFPGGGTINFFGANSGAYAALPTDGSLSRIWGGGNSVNNPQNFGGQIGFVTVPEPATVALFVVTGIGFGLLLRRRRLN